MRIFIGMETSGALRRRFQAQGHDVISCDILPAEDATNCHIVGDVFETLEHLRHQGWWPDLGIFFPTCTYHTLSAAWAFADPDFDRYPGVGYHQNVKPGTLTGEARREARDKAEADVERIAALPIKLKAMENPRGTIPTRTSLGRPAQVVHPYMFGDDASKQTCLWLWGGGFGPSRSTQSCALPAEWSSGRVDRGRLSSAGRTRQTAARTTQHPRTIAGKTEAARSRSQMQ